MRGYVRAAQQSTGEKNAAKLARQLRYNGKRRPAPPPRHTPPKKLCPSRRAARQEDGRCQNLSVDVTNPESPAPPGSYFVKEVQTFTRVRSQPTACVCGGYEMWHAEIERYEKELYDASLTIEGLKMKLEAVIEKRILLDRRVVQVEIEREAACESGRVLLRQLEALTART
jgi:hypothetical protein